MRLSQHFGRTLREAPSEATMTSHQLILRAGLGRPLAAGIWSYLPLGFRVLRRLETIIREEMDAAGTEEMRMPVMHPSEIWEATGRWESFGPAMVRLKNRDGRAFALGPTHEEVIAHLCLSEIESHRDLPRAVYQIQTKERDEPRARGGMVRLREFTMKDAYSMHTSYEDLDRYYRACYNAYLRIFERCGVEVHPVEADTGLMGGKNSHEFMMVHPAGEDRFVSCTGCDYAANVEAAAFTRQAARFGEPAPLEKVETPDCATIDDLCAFLNIPPQQTLKLVMVSIMEGDKEALVMALVRGDLDVNEVKLANALGVPEVFPAMEDAIVAAVAVPGYASPIGVTVREEGGTQGVIVIADESLQDMTNFVTGANEAGYHVRNANYPRDFAVTRFADIAEPFDGAACTRCGGALRIESSIELGHCFKLGTRYSEAVGAVYLDAEGQQQPIIMGSYGIGLDRLMAVIIEMHHDDYGIVWPREVAPYQVHLVALPNHDPAFEAAEAFYAELLALGVDVLYDDRLLSPGVMFADADLMGVPLRVTFSKRSLEKGGAELKWRHDKDRDVVPLDGLAEVVAGMVKGR